MSKDKEKLVDEVLDILRPNKKIDTSRKTANAELVGILAQFIIENPTQRFGQALINLNIITTSTATLPVQWNNEYHTEPHVMVNRAKAALKRFKK